MPSIPQSLLWISLVVLWLFVLVPMLINKRDTVRRTSDVALATRVLNSAAKSRLIRRGGPATGHRHDPEWQREEADFESEFDGAFDAAFETELDDHEAEQAAPVRGRTRSVMVLAAVTEEVTYEPDYLDVDVVDENSGALPVGGGAQTNGVQASLFDAPIAEPEQTAVIDPESTVAEDPTVAEPVAETIAETAAEAGWAAQTLRRVSPSPRSNRSQPAAPARMNSNTSMTLRVWRQRTSRRPRRAGIGATRPARPRR